MQAINPNFLEVLLSRIFALAHSEFLRSRRSETMSPLDKLSLKRHDLWQLKPSGALSEDYKDERQEVRAILSMISGQNPGMLSEDLILRKILYDVIAPRLWDEISDEEADARARQNIHDLVSYKSTRWVDVPVMHLMLRRRSRLQAFGQVTFTRLTDADKAGKWFSDIRESTRGRVFVFGRVEAPGDLETSAHYASKLVRASLLLLRGIGFPIQPAQVEQIGLVNEYTDSVISPYRIHASLQKVELDYQTTAISLAEPLYNLISVEDLIEYIDSDQLSTLLTLFNIRFREGENALNPMQRKILTCFDWIGEATKPDSHAAKLLKLAVALEFLIGGDVPNQPYLTTRGITATLAERAAFLLGNDFAKRKEIDENVKTLYDFRSKIVHGSSSEITNDNLESFVNLVRNLAWSLIAKSDEIRSLEDLAKWTVQQRYI